MTKIIGWSDDDDLCPQMRTKAQQLGELVKFDREDLPDADPSTIAAGLVAAAQSSGAELILVGASKKGKEVAPRLAALLDWPYAAEVQDVRAADGGWEADRMVLSGNCLATYKMGAKAVCTATVGVFEADGEPEAPAEKPSGIEASKVEVLDTVGGGDSDFDLSSADYVVGVGRGFKAKEDIALAEALAGKLPGGAVGCSRPVAADLKWLGEEHWIGLSGHEIRPKVYFASGVSGQIQHVAGIRGSKLIVAINTNKDAPIFQIADYGIVGDLYQILPKLTEAL